MIISASRRTDIPAFYTKWFMNRIRAGYCYVPNPRNMNQLSRVLLDPEDIEAIVFWSKNPAPLMPYLSELDRRGFRYYFQFTLNKYPRALEPNIPSFSDQVTTFRDLSQRIGPRRVVWRYDPIIISSITPFEFHRENFTLIAEELSGATNRVMVSIVDFYKKTERRLSELEKEEGLIFNREPLHLADTDNLLRDMADTASKYCMKVFTCAEEKDYSFTGVLPGRCIDNMLINELWSLNIKYDKDPFQRQSCLCAASKDIGVNDTCIHGCPYCYSTMNHALAQRRYNEHDPASPVLCGKSVELPCTNMGDGTQLRLLK